MYSFDVYDTLITRKTYEPQGIFMIMSYALMAENTSWGVETSFASEFATIRVNAEKIARNAREEEIKIDYIYDVIKSNYNLSSETCDKIKELEMKCELENTIVIPENIKVMEKLISEGEKVILISDIYLPKRFFQELFKRICPVLDDISLYLSCEEKVTKASGLLYEKISRLENVKYSDWTHLGDNIISDVNIPGLLGINTQQYISRADNDSLNRLSITCLDEMPLVKQYLMGNVKSMEIDKGCAYNIGYSFVSVVLYAYVRWIIEQSIKRNMKRLYFIARDGYILKEIADIIIKENGYKIATYYLYGSRKAWRVSEEAVSLVRAYLLQELGENLDEIALVDTQGTGVSIDCISKICKHRFTVFYYVLLESTNDKEINAIPYSIHYGGSMIEAFCRAPHGSTLGYERKDNMVVPVLAIISEKTLKEAGLMDFFKGITDASKKIAEVDTLIKGGIPLLSVVGKTLRYCCESTDIQLASFIGEIPHDTNNDSETKVFAPLLSKEDIKRIEYERSKQDIEDVYEGVDLQLSYRRLDEETRKYVEQCKIEFFSKKVEKNQNCKKVAIYGFGAYGQELYHRLYEIPEVKVIGVIDANAGKFSNSLVEVREPKYLKKMEFDYVIISPLDKHMCESIKNMLVMAGISEKKILFREKCIEMFDVK